MTLCLACEGKLTALPVPHPVNSMLSDGRFLARPLSKARCPACGLISHCDMHDAIAVREFPGDVYDLAAKVAPYDILRSNGYTISMTCQQIDIPTALCLRGDLDPDTRKLLVYVSLQAQSLGGCLPYTRARLQE